MNVIPFTADTPAEAVAQIRTTLGPDAIVLEVKQVQPTGVARLWQKPRLEVLACRPDPETRQKARETARAKAAALEASPLQISTIGESAAADRYLNAAAPPSVFSSLREGGGSKGGAGRWRVESMLANAGLQGIQVQRLMDMIQAEHGEQPPGTLAEELALTREVLGRCWRTPPPFFENSIRPHVLVGPSGVGKTTALCKWLTRAALVEGKQARVWRLDGATANGAENLSIYCEILGIRTHRSWRVDHGAVAADLNFIDLPGVDWRNPTAVAALGERLKEFLAPEVHLVLNAAYEVPILMAQLRAFRGLPIADVIFTHLDDEPRWGKLWNFMLGTNCMVRFLSAGQEVPGGFYDATSELLLGRLLPGPGAGEESGMRAGAVSA